jgi:A/G-specific adenine glycosylase
MKTNEKSLVISDLLGEWYEQNKRILPWRESTDPYIIWVSEIILQQTRVVQGLDYFNRFVRRFPNVASLAVADEDEVLKYWEGLGYYSRARNMHTAAKEIMDRFGGVFPSGYEDVLSLKGIGEYTAAAIVSFAWNQPYPVVDGNVYRVLARVFAEDTPIDSPKGKKLFYALASELMNDKYPARHNQSMMELGALQCVPRNPDCGVCPLKDHCAAFASGKVHLYPVKQNKTKTRNRYLHYFYIIYNGTVLFSRREKEDIWKGLYEFPCIETQEQMDFADLQRTEDFHRLFDRTGQLDIEVELSNIKHVLTHQILFATFYQVRIERMNKTLQSYLQVLPEDMDLYAVPRLLHIYLDKLRGNLSD